jgi:very-short-patch-repair endonuclease
MYIDVTSIEMGRKKTLTEFVEASRMIHGNAYNYDLVVYITYTKKVQIICPIHGIFDKTPSGHIHGKQGCPQCSKEHTRLGLTKTFVIRATKRHGNRYDYSLVDYIRFDEKVKIICRIHGVFEQTPAGHMQNNGCPHCGGRAKDTTETFIAKSRKRHGDEYDYSLTDYTRYDEKVKIICRVHGIFEQEAHSHVRGSGCTRCRSYPVLHTTDTFVIKAKEKHGDKYCYDLCDYIRGDEKVRIVCPYHGEFLQVARTHLAGKGCIDCGGKKKHTTETYTAKCRSVHGNRYDYDQLTYINAIEDVDIVCREHGMFKQAARNHIKGHGCPHCFRKNEGKIKLFLEERGYNNFINDKAWKEVLGRRRPDFIDHDLKLIIEFDGQQHFTQILDWTSPDMQVRIDTWKVIMSMRVGYSVIRIAHNYTDLSGWKDKLCEFLIKHPIPRYAFLSSITSVYDEHKNIYLINKAVLDVDDLLQEL